MNAVLWVFQVIMSVIFMYSGINKSLFSIKKLVYEKGQTGVENLPVSFVRFIGISEILGAIALILPWLLNILPFLTGISAIILAFIMVPASVIHYKRKEYKNVGTNIIIFCICIFIGYGRLFL
jgi:uncharacterized membrane protein YphA (DoxX/SURF4 family)